MKKKVFALTLLTTATVSFAAPISAPNNVNDTPIVSSGGGTTNASSVQCQAYQTDGTAVSLSGGETLIFYGGGTQSTAGGYVSTKSSYSGTAYVKVETSGNSNNISNTSTVFRIIYANDISSGSAIGLFVQNTTNQSDFIAGAGAGGGSGKQGLTSFFKIGSYFTGGYGGGWIGGNGFVYTIDFNNETTGYTIVPGGSFNNFNPTTVYTPGFGGSEKIGGGGASSISAFYDYSPKSYTSIGTSFTVLGGGLAGNPALYVCK